MKAYRLWVCKDETQFSQEVIDYLWDIDEDYTRKKDYIKRAKYLTDKANKKFGTNYTWEQLFGSPDDFDDGYRYCKKHNIFFWKDEGCECCNEEKW